VRRLLPLVLGIGALAALRRRSRGGAAPVADPADELRRKLAHAREAAGDRAEFEAGEVPVDEADASVEERRREVHEAARDVIDARSAPPS
jgi:hypothetical protein